MMKIIACQCIWRAWVISASPPDVSAIDDAGAFYAAYVLGVSKGWEPRLCGAFANAAAGLSRERQGAWAGVPDFEQTLEAMNRLYPNAAQRIISMRFTI
ncbi:MAG: hypothetical protein LBU32_03600 [Clostridiales bacterium]|jgi:sugar/nucleoside kinase (ribokinase family)|nr:hypothetical protein [Clostridiales bacterium]